MPRNAGTGIYTKPFPDVVDGTTIESAVHNGEITDIETDLNAPRPVVAGGTGANNARDAMTMLKGDLAYQVVSNYDTFAFVSGSFYSAAGASGAPVPGHAFTGICYSSDPAVTAPALPASNNLVIEARNQSEALSPGTKYTRQKKAGVWGSWTMDGKVIAGGGGGYEGIGAVGADMFYGVLGTSPTSYFVVNSKADATGGNLVIVPKAGGLVLNTYSGLTTDLNINSQAGAANGLIGSKATLAHWRVQLGNGQPQTGGNAGSDLDIARYDDSGTLIGIAMSITRSTGVVNVNGVLRAGSSLVSAPTATTGVYYFGDSYTKTLTYNGTAFSFTGGPLILDNNLYVGYGAAQASVYFNNTNTKYLTYDGTNFTLAGGAFNVVGATYMQGDTYVGAVTTTGTIRFGTTPGTNYLTFDGTGFVFSRGLTVPGSLVVTGPVNSTGYVCRPGVSGTAPGYVYNINYGTGAQLWIADTNLGTFTLTSDYRIKKDVIDLPGMWDTVKALRPIKYTQAEFSPPSHLAFIEGAKAEGKAVLDVPLFAADDIERWGFLAHELQATLTPSAASGEKDATDTIQTPNPFTLIAALTKALQEAMTRIEALEAR